MNKVEEMRMNAISALRGIGKERLIRLLVSLLTEEQLEKLYYLLGLNLKEYIYKVKFLRGTNFFVTEIPATYEIDALRLIPFKDAKLVEVEKRPYGPFDGSYRRVE